MKQGCEGGISFFSGLNQQQIYLFVVSFKELVTKDLQAKISLILPQYMIDKIIILDDFKEKPKWKNRQTILR